MKIIILMTITLLFISCGKESGGDMSGSQINSITSCEIGSVCNGGIYIGNYLNKRVFATLGSCSSPDPISCIGIAPPNTIRDHCENMVYAGYSDWTVAQSEELSMMNENKIAPDNMITGYYTISGGLGFMISQNPYAPYVSGSRSLCARRLSL